MTERSRVFRADWEAALIGTDLQQFWLDHLLVLSMLLHPTGGWSWGRFVVVYPANNPSVRDAIARYSDVLTTAETFESRTIEDLLDANVLHEPTTAEVFRERYLW